jgi:preprotein translocase subunit SecG
MDYLFSTILLVHIVSAISVIGLVLVQHGKGADMGAAFGSGASGSLFGSTGSANFLSRTTAVLAALFFATSLGLAYIASNKPHTTGSVMQEAVKSQPASTPADAAAKQPESPANPASAADSGSKTKDIPK